MSGAEIAGFRGDHGRAVLTTLRADGRPVPLPVWYVAIDGALYFQTPPRSRKIGNIEGDPRVAVLIDDGHHWAQLRGVLIQGQAELVTDGLLRARVLTAFTQLFAGRTIPADQLPAAVSAHYADQTVFRVAIPDQPLSWDNRKVRLRTEPTSRTEPAPY
jgi:nitroimidazol reductase NimA-like FMN-containing flavoprotein (pyridoxamine 5'-phosphate oxidase superfamily)